MNKEQHKTSIELDYEGLANLAREEAKQVARLFYPEYEVEQIEKMTKCLTLYYYKQYTQRNYYGGIYI